MTIGVYDPDVCVPEGAELVAELYEQDARTTPTPRRPCSALRMSAPYDGMLAMDIHFEDADGNDLYPEIRSVR